MAVLGLSELGDMIELLSSRLEYLWFDEVLKSLRIDGSVMVSTMTLKQWPLLLVCANCGRGPQSRRNAN